MFTSEPNSNLNNGKHGTFTMPSLYNSISVNLGFEPSSVIVFVTNDPDTYMIMNYENSVKKSFGKWNTGSVVNDWSDDRIVLTSNGFSFKNLMSNVISGSTTYYVASK